MSANERKENWIRDFAASAEFGSRGTTGPQAAFVAATALLWSLFQLWYASPLPYILNIGIINDNQARYIHLAFALFLAYAINPSWGRKSDRIPIIDWVLGVAAAVAALYILLFYQQLAARAGRPILVDLLAAGLGLAFVLEATRRSMGPFLVLVAVGFLAYSYFGQSMPAVLQHRGASVTRILEHQWLSSQGVFGVPLGASTGFVFIYVLFGTLFNKAGAGHFIMQLSLAFLGRMKGGPAKVAVVSSGLNGMISGSALANVVSSGIFTIPLMRKTGISGIKAGAIETSASINGQIMPPVMGAAAFIMVEYVGIPYAEVIKHAFLPAIISYISLFYIVHLEAAKIGATPIGERSTHPLKSQLLRIGIGTSGTIILLACIFNALQFLVSLSDEFAGWLVVVLLLSLYAGSIAIAARHLDLEEAEAENFTIPKSTGWEIARTGLHLLIPIIVLIWCLMSLRLSPGISAFWATCAVLILLLTQKACISWLRGSGDVLPNLGHGALEVMDGLVLGARNMVGVALSTATAGIVVGTVTLTGLGLMMTDAIELLSGGNIYLVLMFTALATLILGCGVPTTANYVLVATLMAPVIVELGSLAGLAIPLISVHLFVFYFGIMADATPPVGLGAYAAAAISRESPIQTAVQASIYSFRTGILAFILIFNPEILLIGVTSWWHALIVAVAAIIGSLAFAAGTLRYWFTRTSIVETVALFAIAFTLVYPAAWLNLAYPQYESRPPNELVQAVETADADARLVVKFSGTTIEGDEIEKLASLRLGPIASVTERLAFSGLALNSDHSRVTNVRFGSYASSLKLESGFEVDGIQIPAVRPSTYWVYGAAMLLLFLVAVMQRRQLAISTRLEAENV